MDFLIHWPPGPVVATVQCQGLNCPGRIWSARLFTHLPSVWDHLLLLAYTPDRRDRRLLVSPPKDTGKVG